MNSKILKQIIVGCFVTVPLLSSIISTIHLVDMFYLGNPSWIAMTIAVSIEIGAVASFLTLSILSKLNKIIVWSMFFLLFFMQVVGNVYFSYDWVTQKITTDPNWLVNFKEMIEFFSFEISQKSAKMILAIFVGIPIPLISVMLLKSVADYVGTDITDGIDITPETKETPLTIEDEIKVDLEIFQENEKNNVVPEIHILNNEEITEEERRKRLHPSLY